MLTRGAAIAITGRFSADQNVRAGHSHASELGRGSKAIIGFEW